MSGADTLAGRLRALRQSHWAAPVTQPVLGQVLGVKPPTISSWERADGPAVPADERIQQYARFFATHRSVEQSRLLTDDELTAEERALRDELLDELRQLRAAAVGAGPQPGPEPDPWQFADGAPIRIICGQLDERPPTASGANRNYMALSAYTDQDALVELFGHLRAQNPRSDVQFELAGRLEGDDLHAHLVLLGHMARRQTDLRHWLPEEIQVRQVSEDGIPGEVFEIGERGSGPRFRPSFSRDQKRVVEDVGLLARAPSPLDSSRTLTLISGVFTRGVYGAVRSLTDHELRLDNARYLRERFGDAPTYGLLMRVLVAEHAVGTPKLRDAHVRLHEFP